MPNVVSNISAWAQSDIINGGILGVAILVILFFIHFSLRNKIVKWDAKKLAKTQPDIANALLHNNRFWRGMFYKNPRGFGKATLRRMEAITKTSKNAIQKLTDQFADPSGNQKEAPTLKQE